MSSNNPSSSSSASQGGQGPSPRPRRSTYSLAKAAGFKSAYHAGLSYGIKMYEDGAYDEVRIILEAITDADEDDDQGQVQDGNGSGGVGSAKK
ncbi:hypothetical protein F5B18DRAFT_635449 [Nemania serpens]|nr:hypothetical protein F5B18DRAFT_635449 [Nemania serpens]